MKFGTGDLYVLLLIIFKFRERRRREGGAFLMGVPCNDEIFQKLRNIFFATAV